ncbi:hypothetical protein SDRG_02130 [Saprolegnia diclina VS20]|uniref:TRAPPC10/Trs130 N-terminal domain-containing protein n=1 Tax=Saprolegnia diclina (strain VS20) TaxID=1156394 RepID=T0SDY9_SAPDV|nr:hypothetical protein SDRG_02130 [Saprolegnia diclina VS20]EQC41077.1 hypothetical protein SDRG_02130 [Saprolegnia diclina VS20]|eukprot:XP_008605921.1 hypothetical protein SDRG_02130 [Saprolegnia diclina VS20]
MGDRSFYGSVPQLPQLKSAPSSAGMSGVSVHFEDHGDVWQFVLPSLDERLPLRNIAWKNHLQVNKTIDRLYIHFHQVHTQAQLLKQPSAMPTGVPPTGLVFLFVVKCEDLATYKTKIKPALSAWVDRMNLLKNEWLVLYVPLGTQATSSTTAATTVASRGLSAFGTSFRDSSKVYRRIFEKLRADFGDKNDRLDRLCKIEVLEGNTVVGAAPGQQPQHEAQWSELLLKLKTCIMEAFETRCCEYEEELRLLDAKRSLSGWDFSSFFQVKESLALLYSQTSLYDDALRHYDELEAIFMTLDHTALNDLPVLEASDAIFSSSPFEIDLVVVRMSIAVNAASPLHVRLYLFCRQVAILYQRHDYVAVCARSLLFLPQFLLLLQLTKSLPPTLPLQWAIGAAVALAVSCESEFEQYQVSRPKADQAQMTLIAAPLGELLYFARRACKRLPPTSPTPGRHWYTLCLQPEALHQVTYWASVHYATAGRLRFAAFLSAECARYDVASATSIDRAASLYLKHVHQLQLDQWGDALEASIAAIVDVYRSNKDAAAAATMCLHWLQLEPSIDRLRKESDKGLHTLWLDTLAPVTTVPLHDLLHVLPTASIALPTMVLRIRNRLLRPLPLEKIAVVFRLANKEPTADEATHLSFVLPSETFVLAGNAVTSVTLHSDGSPLTPGPYVASLMTCSMANQLLSLDLDTPLIFDVLPLYASSLVLSAEAAPLLTPQMTVGWTLRVELNDDVLESGSLALFVQSTEKDPTTIPLDGHVLRYDGDDAAIPVEGQRAATGKLTLALPRSTRSFAIAIAVCLSPQDSQATLCAELSYTYAHHSDSTLVYMSSTAIDHAFAVRHAMQLRAEMACVPRSHQLFLHVPLVCNDVAPIEVDPSASALIVSTDGGNELNVLSESLPWIEVAFNPLRQMERHLRLRPGSPFSLSFVLRVEWARIPPHTSAAVRVAYVLHGQSSSLDFPVDLVGAAAVHRPSQPRATVRVSCLNEREWLVQGKVVEFQVDVPSSDETRFVRLASNAWACAGKASQLITPETTTTLRFKLLPLRVGSVLAPTFELVRADGSLVDIDEAALPPYLVLGTGASS